MENAIDIVVSKKAQEGLDQLYRKLSLTHRKIIEISKLQLDFNVGSSPKNPRDFNNTLAEYQRQQAQIQALQRTIQGLEQQIRRLSEARRTNSQRTAEEAVNQSILNTNARNAALANSQLAGAYRNLNAQHTIAAQRVQDLIARGRTATQTQRQYNSELRNAQRDFDRLNQRVVLADRAIGRFNRNVGNYPRQALRGIRDLLGAFGIVGGVALIASITKGIYDQVKAQQSLDLALKQVTTTQDEFLRAQMFIKEQAEINGAQIQSLTGAYTQFYVSAKDKIATKEIEDIFSSITKAGSAMGLSVERQEKAFLALNQMFSKGTVQAEELRGQLGDALPGAIGIMTRAYQKLHPELKVNEASFAKLMKDGKILAAEVLPEFARELERTYNLETIGRIENLATAQNRLTNSVTNFVKALNEGEGAIGQFFTRITNGMSRNIDALAEVLKSESQISREKNNEYRVLYYKRELDALMELGEEKRKQRAEDDREEARRNLDSINADRNTLLDRMGYDRETKEFSGKITEDDVRLLRFYNKEAFAELGVIAATNKVLNEKKQLTGDIGGEDEKARKARLKAQDEEEKNLYNLNRLRLESDERLLEELVNNENDYSKTRIKNNELLNKTQIELAELNKKEGFRQAKGNTTLQLIVLEEYYKDYESIVKNNEERILEIQKQRFKEFQDYVSSYDGDGLKLDLESLGLTKDGFDEFRKKSDDTKKSLEDLKKATEDWATSFTEGFFSDAGFPTLFKILNKELEGFGKDFTVTFLAISEAVQEAYNFMNQASQQNFEAEYERLEKRKEVSLMFAGESAEAREEIERQYDDRRKEIETREAKAKKELALFNIAVNTAQAIVGFLANPGGTQGIGLSIAAGVIGAAQAVLVASKEIPQFWQGTDNAPEGWAMVDEKVPEVHTDKNNNIKSTGGKGPNLRYLKAGDKIYKSHDDFFNRQMEKILYDIGISPFKSTGHHTQNNDNSLKAEDIDAIMGKYFSRIQTSNISFDKKGITQWAVSSGQRTERANNSGTSKGYSV